MSPEAKDPRKDEGPSTSAGDPVRTITTEELMAGNREILIVHRGEKYHLKVTRNGKLILTK